MKIIVRNQNGNGQPIGKPEMLKMIVESVVIKKETEKEMSTLIEEIKTMENLKLPVTESLKKKAITLHMKFLFFTFKEHELLNLAAETIMNFSLN